MATRGVERRLAAIMFTDIVGYTALMGESEEKGHRVRRRHREVLRPLVEQYAGEWIQDVGDESLSSFPSAVDAANCALAIQDTLRDETELRVRIGIHVGDVLLHEGSLHGDGVNVASRIRPFAEPGGTCVSEQVYDSVRNQPNLAFRSLGEQTLKNVERPVEVFAIGRPGSLDTRPAGSPVRRRRLYWAAACGAVLIALLGTGYALRRPLLRIAIPILMRTASPPYEQEIAIATTSDGVKIAYASVGRGPTVVIVPGWISHLERGLGSPIFDPFVPRLRDRHQVVRYDQRGNGLSDRDVDDLSLEGRVRDLEAVVDALGIQQLALFGSSAGGPPAILYTARHPERVTRLVIYGSTAHRAAEERAEWQALAAAARVGWGRDHSSIRKLFSLLLIPEADEVTLQALNELQRMAVSPEAVAFFMAENAQLDVRDSARRIRVPTLVMHVEGDQAVQFKYGRELAGLIPGARFLPIPGVNHLGGDEELALMLSALEEWLAEDLAPAPLS